MLSDWQNPWSISEVNHDEVPEANDMPFSDDQQNMVQTFLNEDASDKMKFTNIHFCLRRT